MIQHVSFEHTTFERPPLKFEAGTPDYVAAHGLAVALDYITQLGLDDIAQHEHNLTKYALEQMQAIPDINIYGHQKALNIQSDQFGAVVSFNVGNIHHSDMGTLLDQLGIAVRTGHHCAQPLMDCLGILGTVRASFALYNTREEVDILLAGIKRVSQMF